MRLFANQTGLKLIWDTPHVHFNKFLFIFFVLVLGYDRDHETGVLLPAAPDLHKAGGRVANTHGEDIFSE